MDHSFPYSNPPCLPRLRQAGAQRTAAALGIALVAPDTSPRGLDIEGQAESWDFGVGAGFYLVRICRSQRPPAFADHRQIARTLRFLLATLQNAAVDKWKNWRMYDYVVDELPGLLAKEFPQLDTDNASVMGHSMGGHGALTIALKNPTKYKARMLATWLLSRRRFGGVFGG